MKRVILFCLLYWASYNCIAMPLDDERRFKVYVDSLVEHAGKTDACRGVYISLGCFGLESCKTLEEQKQKALLPFSSVGLQIHAIENYWRRTEGYNSKKEYRIDLYEVPNNRREKQKARTELIFTKNAQACALILGQSLSVYIRLQKELTVETPLPVVPFNGQSHRKLIMFDWKN